MQNECLYLVWKDPETRQIYTVGKLTRGTKYRFEYCEGAGAAEEAGWRPLGSFPDYRVYESDSLFPVFSCRLPDHRRRDIQRILDKYGLEHYDAYEILRKSGAKLPIDTYEFVSSVDVQEE